MFCFVHLPMFLLYIMMHMHLMQLEPFVKDAVVIAKNPMVRHDAKLALGAVKAYRQHRAKH